MGTGREIKFQGVREVMVSKEVGASHHSSGEAQNKDEKQCGMRRSSVVRKFQVCFSKAEVTIGREY